jgi:hypothetical protein
MCITVYYNSTIKKCWQEQEIWLAQEATTWFGSLIPFNHLLKLLYLSL